MTVNSSLLSCFRPIFRSSADLQPSTTMASPISPKPNLTTCFYQTDVGVTALTWCRHVIGRGLNVDLQFENGEEPLSLSFHLHIKPFLFWRKKGAKKFNLKNTKRKIEIYWDLTKAKFASSPEPQSGFYVSLIVDGEMILLVGDSHNEAYNRTKARKPERTTQVLILRREHVFGNKVYTTKARFGGKTRDISIECCVDDEPRLRFSVDRKRVLQIKQLKWKFRGNEKIEVDGVPIQVSWDVFNWLFDDVDDGHAVFMFRFEKLGFGDEAEEMQLCGGGYLGMNEIERKKLNKKSSSSSSSSISSASSGCSSSIMEWSSTEENELQRQSGFSLLIYAWKS